ncbi:MAG: hypothetical protein HGA66_17595 [Holophaga sp.]|nr:hypothetical protein [Holophaga sp.]
MRYFSVILASALMALSVDAAGSGGTVLDYKIVVRMRDGGAPLESRLQVVTTAPVATRNKVKRPRFVGWRIRAFPGRGGLPPASVLARVESLLYLEGPTSGVVPREGGMRFGKRFCRLWQAVTPSSVGAFVYLAEVSPNLLALSYLSASIPEGALASIELHLEGVSLGPAPAPAEDGTVLLRTLRRWGALVDDDQQVMITEQIQ